LSSTGHLAPPPPRRAPSPAWPEPEPEPEPEPGAASQRRCPHCKKFKHSFEVIGSYFNTEPRPEPRVTVARVDCADWPVVCRESEVKFYPTLRMGRASDFLHRRVGDLVPLTHGYATDVEVSIVRDVAAVAGATYDADLVLSHAVPLTPAPELSAGARGPQQTMVDLRDTALATATQFRQMQETPALLRGAEARAALQGLLPFLARYHPIDTCRGSFAELEGLLPAIWAEGAEAPSDLRAFAEWEPCGGQVTWEEWGACKGSSPDQRGFSCGFWQMLHGIAASVRDEDAQPFVRAIGDFMLHHFGCHNCGEHFHKAALSPKSGGAVATARDAVLWMWRVHNIVNTFTAPWSDPAYPKEPWPPAGLCRQCSRNGGRPGADGKVEWNDEQVYLFLTDFYGFTVEGDRVRHISGAEGKSVSAAPPPRRPPRDPAARPRGARAPAAA